MHLKRFVALPLLILCSCIMPNLARAEACRLFILKDLASPALNQTLKERGYAVQITDKITTSNQMSQVYDAALARDKNGKLGLWIRLAGNENVLKTAIVPSGDVTKLPTCKQLPDYASEVYFNLAIGDEARRRLDNFYETHTLAPGLGHLILKAEALRMHNLKDYWPAYKKAEAKYDILVKQVRRAWDLASGVSMPARLNDVHMLLHDYYRNYVRDVHMMTSLLDPSGGGDCESSTQLILASIVDARIDLGGFSIGEQLFADHVQPILINNETLSIVEMTAGSVALHNAPIYSPEVITWAIANAAGRAMPQEREFIKMIDMYYSNMDPRMAFDYYVRDLREDPKWPWGYTTYLRYDPVFSKFGNGPIPEKAQIFAFPLDHPQPPGTGAPDKVKKYASESGGESKNQDVAEKKGSKLLDEIKYGAGMLAGMAGAMSNLPFQILHGHLGSGNAHKNFNLLNRQDYLRLNQKYFTLFASSHQPTFESGYMEQGLSETTDNKNKFLNFNLNVLALSRPATEAEERQMPDDMDFGFTIEKNLPPNEELQLHASKVEIVYPAYTLVYRPTFQNDDLLSNPLDQYNIREWIVKSFTNTLKDRVGKVDLQPMIAWVHDKSTLLLANDLALRTLEKDLGQVADLARFRSASEGMDSNVRMPNISLPPANSICPIFQGVHRMGLEFKNSPRETLSWLANLDSDSRQRFFKFFVLWNTLLKIAPSTYNCFSNNEYNKDWEIYNKPLEPLVKYVVRKILDDEKQIKIIKPEIVSVVYLIPTMDDSLIPPDGKRGNRTRIGNSPHSAPEVQPQQAEDQSIFKIRTEVLYGLIASAENGEISSPEFQLAFAKVWTPEGQKYFKAAWWSSPAARENFLRAWSWSPLLGIPDWMDAKTQRLAEKLNALPGVFASSSKKFPAYTRIPDFLLPDVKAAAALSRKNIKFSQEKPALNIVRMHIQKSVNASITDGCPSDNSLSQPEDFDELVKQTNATGVLPQDLSYLTWIRFKLCDGSYKLQGVHWEQVSTGIGEASTQRIIKREFSLTPGPVEGQMDLLIYSSDQSVKDALKASAP